MQFCPAAVLPGTPPAKETKPDANAKADLFADNVTVDANGNYSLKGHVEVRQDDRKVTADEAQYDEATHALSAKGSVVYEDPIVRLSGRSGSYSPTAGADVSSAQFELLQRSARGSASSIDLTPAGIIDLRGVTFTTCPRTDESWQLHAKALKLDTGRQVGTGRGASVDFQGVPVLYIPWFSFPLGNDRKTGFLFPSIGNSSLSGFELQAPFYWNIAPNADVTFYPMLYSRRGIDLAGDARFLTSNQSGELTWHYLPDDRLAGHGIDARAASDRSFVRLRDTMSLPDDVRISVDAANVSDVDYFQDFGNGPEATSTAFVERRAIASYRDEYWNLGAEAQQYQTIDVALPGIYRPYARAPRLYADGDFGWGSWGLFRYGFDSELVNFTRSVGVTGWRLDLSPRVGFDYEDPGYFIRSSLAWRYTAYSLDNVLPGEASSPSRSLPIASFESGLEFEGPAGGGRSLTVEPRMQYVYVPYRNQDSLPLFDTALPDLNLVQLFRTNRFVGADRVSDADQLTAGVTTRLLSQTGQQYLAATLGETYDFETPRVQLPGETLDDRKTSDIVGEVVLSAFKNWNVDLNLQWNPAAPRAERTFVQLQFKPGAESVINVAYRYQRNIVLPTAYAIPGPGYTMAGVGYQSASLDQAEVSGAWPVARHWSVLGRMVYDLDVHQALDRLFGFEYSACCWRVRVLARRYVINGGLGGTTGEQDTAYLFQLQLTGLAGVGPATDAFLGTAIRGYSPASSSR
ncbi:MAG TPA: LPS assembly protein LptD [Steroidobacteraceae bacterium]|nr:LPS assembly protein LptD [Steroidobacteraceae bacterium]